MEAVKFIGDNRSNPFFLYLPYYAVHEPIQAPGALVDKYKAKAASGGHANPGYAAMIESADANIGLLLAKLDELGLSQNTVVVFTSDNGGITGSNSPLRSKKGSLYEGGIREPFIVRWPGKVLPGSVSETPIIGTRLNSGFDEANAPDTSGYVTWEEVRGRVTSVRAHGKNRDAACLRISGGWKVILSLEKKARVTVEISDWDGKTISRSTGGSVRERGRQEFELRSPSDGDHGSRADCSSWMSMA